MATSDRQRQINRLRLQHVAKERLGALYELAGTREDEEDITAAVDEQQKRRKAKRNSVMRDQLLIRALDELIPILRQVPSMVRAHPTPSRSHSDVAKNSGLTAWCSTYSDAKTTPRQMIDAMVGPGPTTKAKSLAYGVVGSLARVSLGPKQVSRIYNARR